MQSRVFAISIDNECKTPHITVYRTDGTAFGGTAKTYNLTVNAIIRLMRVMVKIAKGTRTWVDEQPGWVNWTVGGVLEAQAARFSAHLDRMTLG